MKSIACSGFRRSIGQYVRLASRYNPIVVSALIRCSGLREFCRAHNLTVTTVFLKTIAGLCRDIPVLNSVLSRRWLQRRIFFPESVDIAVAIQKQWRGEQFITSPVIRDVGAKTCAEIKTEIDSLAQMPLEQMPDMRARLILNRLPSLMQYLCMYCICQHPDLFVRYFGAIGLSNLGACGIRGLYPVWLNSAVFALGELMDEPVAAAGRVEVAPVLYITLSFNHCVMDGADAARILAAVKTAIESQDYLHMVHLQQ